MSLKNRLNEIIAKYHLAHYQPLTKAQMLESKPLGIPNIKIILLRSRTKVNISSLVGITPAGNIQLLAEAYMEQKSRSEINSIGGSVAGRCLWFPLSTYEKEWILIKC